MTTVDGFVKHCHNAGKGIERASLVGVNRGAVVMAASITASAAAATHGTMTLRGMKRKPKLGVRVIPASSPLAPVAVVSGKPPGPWKILQSGAKAHEVGAPKSRGKRKGQRAVMVVGGQVRTGPWEVPGSPGKGTFSHAVEVAHPKVTQEVRKQTSAEMVRAFRG